MIGACLSESAGVKRLRRLLQLAAGELWSGLPSMAVSETFHHYRILRREDESLWELGRGGMGVTFKALDTRLGCVVALKVINPSFLNSDTARQRFQREARAAASLRHPNVPWVSYLGCEGDEYFYAMEFITGETVEALVKRQGPLDARLAVRILLQVADALAAAHKVGLVHRDIKPSNLMLVRQEEEIVVKLIDFGLAKFLEGEMDVSLTQGGLLCTPPYASPEQLHAADVDVRSDIYSLGVTLWYLVTGTLPFSGSLPQLIHQHLNVVPDFGRLAGHSREFVGILSRMLAKEPVDRPQTPQALKLELKTCLRAMDRMTAPERGNPRDGPRQHDTPSINLDEIIKPPAIGMMLVGRYRLVQWVSEDEWGVVFRAEDTEQRSPVGVRVLSPGALPTPQARAAFEHDAAKAQAAAHPNLTRLICFDTADKPQFLVQEWLNGFSLVELLRRRRELPLSETLLILEQMAAAIDHALAKGLARLDLELSRITLHFPSGIDAGARERRLSAALTEWPPFLVKLDSCATPADSIAGTWSGSLTIFPAGLATEHSGDLQPRYLRRAAIVCCELLGAWPRVPQPGEPRSGVPAFSPTPSLTEYGNEVIKRCLAEPSRFVNVQEFVAALKSGAARVAPAFQPLPPQRTAAQRQAAALGTKQRARWGWAAAAIAMAAALWIYTVRNPPVTRISPPSANATPMFQPTPPPPPRQKVPLLNDALALLEGEGVPKDAATAVKMLQEIIDASDDSKAREALGRCFLEGNGTPPDLPKARELLESAVAKHNHDARVALAKMHMEGLGVPKSSTVAASLLRDGAKAGSAACMYNYALCLQEGAGLAQDIEAAQEWFRKAAAADSR